jgi:hypothetical protein
MAAVGRFVAAHPALLRSTLISNRKCEMAEPARKTFHGESRLEIDQETGARDRQILNLFARPVHLMDGCRFADRDAPTSVEWRKP